MKVKTLLKPLHILGDNYKLHDFINDNELLLVCADNFTDAECAKHLTNAEKEIQSLPAQKKTKKRVFYIIVESIQNIARHKSTLTTNQNNAIPMMVVGSHQNKPYVLTANPIENEKIDLLKAKIDIINKTGAGDLKKLYTETLNDGSFNDAGGANLGLIDMARKAGGQLQYGFEKINNTQSYFVLKINIEQASY